MGVAVADGAAQLAALAAALKAAGNKGLQRELSKGINSALKPLKAAVAQSALAKLPSSGGLAARAAGIPVRTRRNANGVRVVASGRGGMKNVKALDAGSVRHPVFGRNAWVSQSVTPGFWTEPTEALAPEVRAELMKAIDAVAKQIEGSV